MKDLQTIARPYAKALFELALEHNALTSWNTLLSNLALAIHDEKMQKLIGHPEISQNMLVEILMDIIAQQKYSSSIVDLARNTLLVMAEHHRLAVLPEVAKQYEELKAKHEQTCSGTVFSSIKLDANQLQRLEAGLKKKLNKTVHLTQVVEPALLGGARVQIGDMVIDGTLRGRVQRLTQSLLAH